VGTAPSHTLGALPFPLRALRGLGGIRNLRPPGFAVLVLDFGLVTAVATGKPAKAAKGPAGKFPSPGFCPVPAVPSSRHGGNRGQRLARAIRPHPPPRPPSPPGRSAAFMRCTTDLPIADLLGDLAHRHAGPASSTSFMLQARRAVVGSRAGPSNGKDELAVDAARLLDVDLEGARPPLRCGSLGRHRQERGVEDVQPAGQVYADCVSPVPAGKRIVCYACLVPRCPPALPA